eukprot:CAMPEP_0184985976 /NCGR_PEP_ID=MMETSP1098-20130426/15149_1 /TAXON_ID=89044 /ORGANISM="Spumella elongata, Strain CCAP 955/1" /LENGTH=58 /DNA_ID=CAMNT_0027510115 /DNA_START=31 /DNA_END=207 /DNA_ORIENTATION=+
MAGHNLVGKLAARQIAKQAAIGTAVGLVFAFVYKFTVSDPQANAINNYYSKQAALKGH